MLHTPAQQEPGVTVERLQTKEGEPAKVGERAYDKETGRLAQVGLVQQIGMLPTPSTKDVSGGAVKAIPTGTGFKRVSKQGVSHGAQLHDVMKTLSMLPTPRAGNPGSRPNEKGGKILAEEVGKNRGLKLQPAFVEWMMGYPEGWTDLKV